jgi:flagellar biosynthesis/type III secretory pathway protein FliH
MMQVKENPDSTKDDGNQKSEALKTEEILSLLSKQNSDFQKESEISSNITKLYKKIDLASLAKSKSVGEDKKGELEEKEGLNETKPESEEIDEQNKEDNEQNKELEKKYTETEAKVMANKLAKEYYDKGIQVGIKKTKAELQKGDHELAVSLKNIADNLLLKTPEFSEKLNLSIVELLKKSINEILGYEIDENSEFFKNKILSIIDSINSSIEKIDVILNEKDHNAVTKYLNDKKLELPFNLSQDTSLNRGDILIKAGSIEVREMVDKKIKYSKSITLEPEVKNIGNKDKTPPENLQSKEPPNGDIKSNN